MGVIPEESENWKDRQKEGVEYASREIKSHRGGRKIKREQMERERERVAALKNIWESSGSGEKNAGLS